MALCRKYMGGGVGLLLHWKPSSEHDGDGIYDQD